MKGFFVTLISILMYSSAIASTGGSGKITGTINVTIPKFKANTVVYIDKVEGDFPAPEKHSEMDQKNLTFIPHVLPVVKGTFVDFVNNDDVLHNVFSPDACAQKFNLGTWAKGEKRSYQFNEVGCDAAILCNVHPEMEAFVLVMQNPFFAVTDKNGTFKIDNVPPGKYTLKVWNEKYKKTPSQEITVAESGTVEVTFTLSK